MKPCLCMNVPYGHSFHTGKDGHVYTRLRPSSDYPCAGNAVAAVNERFELKLFDPAEAVVWHVPAGWQPLE